MLFIELSELAQRLTLRRRRHHQHLRSLTNIKPIAAVGYSHFRLDELSPIRRNSVPASDKSRVKKRKSLRTYLAWFLHLRLPAIVYRRQSGQVEPIDCPANNDDHCQQKAGKRRTAGPGQAHRLLCGYLPRALYALIQSIVASRSKFMQTNQTNRRPLLGWLKRCLYASPALLSLWTIPL